MPSPIEIVVYAYFESSYGRDILHGITSYARAHRGWIVRPVSVKHRGSARELKRGAAKGIIVTASTAEMAEFIRSTGKPAVNVSGQLERSPLPRVTVDNLLVGQQAARHLWDFGVRSFAYAPDLRRSGRHHAQRRAGFLQAVQALGEECRISELAANNIPKEMLARPQRPDADLTAFMLTAEDTGPSYRPNKTVSRALKRWLTALPWQTGILASSVSMAADIFTTCRDAQIAIPDRLLVLGVDHDPLQDMLAGAPLSSVDVNGAAIGYEAARLLDRMLQGENVSPDTDLAIQPTGVVTGATTDFVSEKDEYVARIRRYIRHHLDRPLSVDELTDQVPLCRRTLEKRFKHVVGRSLSSEIRRMRIEAAKDLLGRTSMTVGAIAFELGFGELKSLSTTFRREVGVTPTDYRATAQQQL